MSGDATLRLRDGRILAFRETGAPEGVPMFYFHGLPGSRLECWGGTDPYRAASVRLITTDRPGIGRSDPQPGRTLLDWPADVAELAGTLGLGRFAVVGHSLGGAYALACAYALPELVAATAIVGGVPRLDQPGGIEQMGTARFWRMARDRPAMMRASWTGLVSALRVAPALGHWLFFRHASEPDRIAVDRPEVRRRYRQAVLEAARPGVPGLVDDMHVALKPWGFTNGDIAVEVMVWHGQHDRHVPPSVAERYADAIPRCRFTLVEDEGHFSLIERHAERIVRGLVESAAEP